MASLKLLLLAATLAGVLMGCGGGSTEPDKPKPDVDCQARPEQCR